MSINHDYVERVYERDGYRCQSCGGSVYQYGTPQLSHRCPQRKHLIRRYGEAAIHHPSNLVAACSLECNGRLQLHASEWPAHMQYIQKLIQDEQTKSPGDEPGQGG